MTAATTATAARAATTRAASGSFVTFGEIMLRLCPPGFQRLAQARSFDASFGGGEANVAVSLARLGLPAQFVTRLPAGDLGDACVGYLRQFGVGTDHIARGGDRLGIYYLEAGAVQRASQVIYDRAGSALAEIEASAIDWQAALAGALWFHITGITPAVSARAADAALVAARAAREAGATVSCDLNYRAKLWRWGRPAGEVMAELVACCDVVIGNEEDAARVFGVRASDADVDAGELAAASYRGVCEQLGAKFPNVQMVAITLRESVSASHNGWSGVLWDRKGFHVGPRYDIAPIVDRVGAGDAFAAGLIYGLVSYPDRADALRFAVAASCLKHTIPGDFNLVSAAEVEALMRGQGSGRIRR